MAQLKDIISAALGQVQGMTRDQAATKIADLVDFAFGMHGLTPPSTMLLGGPVPIVRNRMESTIPGIAGTTGLVQAVQPPATHTQYPEPELPPQRIIPRRVESDVHYRTVEDIAEYLDRTAPATMEILPKGAREPITVVRKIDVIASADGVRLSYSPTAGDIDAPKVFFSTMDERYELGKKMDELKTAIQNVYSIQSRTLEPRAAPQINFEIGSGNGGFGGGNADTMTEAGTQMAARWESSRTPEQIAFMQGNG